MNNKKAINESWFKKTPPYFENDTHIIHKKEESFPDFDDPEYDDYDETSVPKNSVYYDVENKKTGATYTYTSKQMRGLGLDSPEKLISHFEGEEARRIQNEKDWKIYRRSQIAQRMKDVGRNVALSAGLAAGVALGANELSQYVNPKADTKRVERSNNYEVPKQYFNKKIVAESFIKRWLGKDKTPALSYRAMRREAQNRLAELKIHEAANRMGGTHRREAEEGKALGVSKDGTRQTIHPDYLAARDGRKPSDPKNPTKQYKIGTAHQAKLDRLVAATKGKFAADDVIAHYYHGFHGRADYLG